MMWMQRGALEGARIGPETGTKHKDGTIRILLERFQRENWPTMLVSYTENRAV